MNVCLYFLHQLPGNNKFVNKTDEFSLRGCVCEGGGGRFACLRREGGRQKHLAGGRRKKRYATADESPYFIA